MEILIPVGKALLLLLQLLAWELEIPTTRDYWLVELGALSLCLMIAGVTRMLCPEEPQEEALGFDWDALLNRE